MARLYTYAVVSNIASETGMTEADVETILGDQAQDMNKVLSYVGANQGGTEADALANAWIPGEPPTNAQEVLDVLVAANALVRVGA